MSIGYYVREFPAGCSGAVVVRQHGHVVVVVDEALPPIERTVEVLELLTHEEIQALLVNSVDRTPA